MIDEQLIKSFVSATLRKIHSSTYAYVPFMNPNTMENCNIDYLSTNTSDKIIIYDTETYYVNISTLVAAFGEDDSKKRAGNFTRTAWYKSLINSYTEELNNLPNTNKLKQRLLKSKVCVNGYLYASFLERNTRYSPNCSGTFVHPSIIINVLVWCNKRLASELNSLIMIMLMHQGTNMKESLKTNVKSEALALQNDAKERNDVINGAETYDKEKFNKAYLQYQLNATSKKYSTYKPRNLIKKIQKAFSKQLILVRYYDEDEFIYDPLHDDYDILFDIHVINSADLDKMLEKYTNKIEDECTGTITLMSSAIPISTQLISSFPYTDDNVMQEFVTQYSETIMLEERDGKYITQNFGLLKDSLVGFVDEYIDMNKY